MSNWRHCYRATRERHPRARYFAWASDHDVWEPLWAARLAAELDAHPEAVLAYPLAERLPPDGAPPAAPTRWDTGAARDAPAAWRPPRGG